MAETGVAFSFAGIRIHWYGIIIACALVIGVILAVRDAKRRGYRSDMILDFLLIAIPICIICARLYYVAFEWDNYSDNLLRIFAVWEGGLAIYGAVIGGAIAAFIFHKWRRVPVGDILDIGAPSIVLGQAIGRWGNFINQEAFGNLITDPSMQWFPYGVYIERAGAWYQATFFYESMWDLLTFVILMLLRKKIKARGGLFALYVAIYGFGRFFVESLRSDSLMAGGFRVSQVLSAVLVVCGIIYLTVTSRSKKEYPAYEGIYSLSRSAEQIETDKKNAKLIRAREAAAEAEKKFEEAVETYGPASGMAKKAKEKAEEARKKAQVLERQTKDNEKPKEE